MFRWESSGFVRPEAAPSVPHLPTVSPQPAQAGSHRPAQGESLDASGGGGPCTQRAGGADPVREGCGHLTEASGYCLTSCINTYSFDKANIRLFKNNFWKTPNRNVLSKTPSVCWGSRPSEPPVWGGAGGVRATAASRLLLHAALLTAHWRPRYSRCPPCAHPCAWLCACLCARPCDCPCARPCARSQGLPTARLPASEALPVFLHSPGWWGHLLAGVSPAHILPHPSTPPASIRRLPLSDLGGSGPQAPTPAVGTGGPGAQGPASLSP